VDSGSKSNEQTNKKKTSNLVLKKKKVATEMYISDFVRDAV
jgi:hypothetical protein